MKQTHIHVGDVPLMLEKPHAGTMNKMNYIGANVCYVCHWMADFQTFDVRLLNLAPIAMHCNHTGIHHCFESESVGLDTNTNFLLFRISLAA